jgi:hypothetical protein
MSDALFMGSAIATGAGLAGMLAVATHWSVYGLPWQQRRAERRKDIERHEHEVFKGQPTEFFGHSEDCISCACSHNGMPSLLPDPGLQEKR